MNTFTQKWAVAAMLEDVPEGAQFHSSDFPLHVTIAGVFAVEQNGAWLVNQLSSALHGQSSLEIEAEETALFGPDQDIPVMKVKKTSDLLTLYQRLHSCLVQANVAYRTPEYEGDGYGPHATVQKSGSLRPGEKRRITSVSLIDLYPSSDGHQRKIYKTIGLL